MFLIIIDNCQSAISKYYAIVYSIFINSQEAELVNYGEFRDDPEEESEQVDYGLLSIPERVDGGQHKSARHVNIEL